MSNDPSSERPSDGPPNWGADPAPNAGPDPSQGWGQEPLAGPGGRAASVGKRVGAYIVDAIGLGIVVGLVLYFTGLGGGLAGMGTGQGYVANLLSAVAVLAYFGLMEAGSGQTIAKKMFGIKAVAANGGALTLQSAVVRRLPFVVGSLIPTSLGGLVQFVLVLAILITAIQDEPDNRGIHDKWAGTRVVEA